MRYGMSDLISRQEAINAAVEAMDEYDGCYDASRTEYLEQVLMDLPPVQPGISQWIPVTDDTLPDEGKVVVALGKKGTWDFGTYRGHGGNIHYWVWKKNTYKKVYWWMYKDNALPKPYREGGKENDPD